MPTRTCLSCRQQADPQNLHRVRAFRGDLFTSGPSGRSAYVCRATSCISVLGDRKRLERALRTPIQPSALDNIRQEILCNQELWQRQIQSHN